MISADYPKWGTAAVALMAWAVLGSDPVNAQAGCSDLTPTTRVCEGDQSAGIEYTNSVYTTLLVRSLTTDIVTADLAGIGFYSDTGGPMAVISDTRPFGISTTGDDAPGIWIKSNAVSTDSVLGFSSGDVVVSSHGAITTTGEESYAIVVDLVTSVAHSTAIANSDGGNALVSSFGPIVTYGLDAVGIDVFNAVSAITLATVGVGAAWGGDLTINAHRVETHGRYAGGIRAQQNLSAVGTIAVARGGSITINSTGIVTTRGDDVDGISARVLGSAFGVDATAIGASLSVTSQDVETFGASSVGVSARTLLVADGDTAEARSGEISLTSNGVISMHGDGSLGMMVDTNVFATAFASVMNTATVSSTRVDNNGVIVARGVAAHGIIIHQAAEATVGHGGGDAAASVGSVIVNSNDVRTVGDGSVGILVMSGAATAGTSGFSSASTGPITINSRDVSVIGDFSSGILVQSIADNFSPAGSAVAGDIEVNTSGVLAVTGSGSVGIMADSDTSFGGTRGNIAINVLSGSVTGGSGTGAGILIGRSATGTVTNSGTVSALSGLAIAGVGSVQTIENFGTIIGSVDLGVAQNRFDNHASGVFASGHAVHLGGSGNALTNAGILTPGQTGFLQTTMLDGDLAQTSTGRYAVDLEFGALQSDLLDVTGTASLGGVVVANVVGAPDAPGFSQQFHILHAAGGVTDDGLAAADTAVIDYSVIFDPNGQDVHLGAVIDFSGRGTGLNPNQTRIGQGLNLVQASGVPASMAAGMAALMNVPTTTDLARAYDQLSPETFGQQLTEAQVASEDFSNALMSCREAGGPNAAIREGECLWARARASDVDVAGSATNIGSKSRVGSFAAGLQVAMAADWRIGVALGYDLVSRSTPSGTLTDGDRTSVGAVVKYNPGPFLLAAGAAASWGTFETDRRMAFGGFAATATSKSDTDYVTGWLQAAYLADQGRWYLKPLVEARVTELDFSGARDTGGGGLGLVVSGSRDTMISVSPALEVGTEFRFDALAVWRPFVRAGVTWRDEDTFVTQAAFAGAPLGGPGFYIVTDVDDVLFDISAGVDVIGGDGAVLKVQYDGRFGSTLSQNSVSLKGSVPF